MPANVSVGPTKKKLSELGIAIPSKSTGGARKPQGPGLPETDRRKQKLLGKEVALLAGGQQSQGISHPVVCSNGFAKVSKGNQDLYADQQGRGISGVRLKICSLSSRRGGERKKLEDTGRGVA